MEDGYYWARNPSDMTIFVVLHEDGEWFCCGVEEAINEAFDPRQIIAPIERPND